MDVWPIQLLRPKTERWYRRGSPISGGVSLSGRPSFAESSGGGFWISRQAGFLLNDADRLRAWALWQERIGRGTRSVVVPMWALRTAPRPILRGKPIRPAKRLGPLPYVDDETIFERRIIEAELVGASALRDTTAVIEMTRGASIRGGEFFSINHATKGHHLYCIAGVPERDGDQFTVEFGPPLREATADGTRTEFDLPACTMNVIDAEEMALERTDGQVATPSVTFAETGL